MGSKFFEIKGGSKVRTLNFLSGGSVLVEKKHTPETKKYHFSKILACGGRLSCNFTHKMFISGIRGLEHADKIIIGDEDFSTIKGGDIQFSD